MSQTTLADFFFSVTCLGDDEVLVAGAASVVNLILVREVSSIF